MRQVLLDPQSALSHMGLIWHPYSYVQLLKLRNLAIHSDGAPSRPLVSDRIPLKANTNTQSYIYTSATLVCVAPVCACAVFSWIV